ncbi:MAG: CoA protein activase [Firmicutes bacterium]|jgi:predicted nucleotide-binding protein (sugar kinase/HSP70/actin superfamily)|nr:CoA protein activase [Bacillota bacterium]MDH7495540.1 CoA protein activase [Bacillota bacterium]
MKVTFAHMGNLYITVKALLEDLGVEVVVPPMPSKRTLSIGSRHSPEFACLPLKVNIGNYIEALELGADTIAMAGGVGPCRFGLYGEVQREILKGLGYEFDMVIIDPPQGRLRRVLQQVGRLVGRNSVGRYLRAVRLAWAKMTAVDELEKLAQRVRPFESRRGEASAALERALRLVDEASSIAGVKGALEDGREALLDVKAPGGGAHSAPRIGVVGEVYVVLEPFVNFDVERRLGEMGVLVERSIYIGDWVREHVFKDLLRLRKGRRPYDLAKPYLCHFVGGHGIETVGHTVEYAHRRFDGVIQLAPFTCMPEIVAQDVLPSVSRDMGIPVMTLIFDEHSSDAGVLTRLEAFVDLVERSRSRRDAM